MEPCKSIPSFLYTLRLTTYSDSLLSFGKFLELLVYSNPFHIITPPLCEHTGTPVESKADAAPSRPGLNIARHFTYRTHRITFTLAVVQEIYNIEVPRVQFVYGAHVSEEAKPIAGPQRSLHNAPTPERLKPVM
jgi:1-phosphatidylinositol-3-phosphate 5-kinase